MKRFLYATILLALFFPFFTDAAVLDSQTGGSQSMSIGVGTDPLYVNQEIDVNGMVDTITIKVSGTIDPADTFKLMCRTSAPTQFDSNGNCFASTTLDQIQVSTSTRSGDFLTGYFNTPVAVNSSPTEKWYIVYFPASGTRTLYGSSTSSTIPDCVADPVFGSNVACSTYGINDIYYEINGEEYDLSTHIISLTPENGTTTGNLVDFSFTYYLAPEDVGTRISVQVYLRNIDQNVLLLNAFSPSDIEFLDFIATSSGEFTFSTTTSLGDGNYRIKAQLKKSIFGLTLPNVGVFDEISNQFIVNQATFIGNISQNSFSQLNSIFASSTATSTAALAGTCNPISNNVATLFLNPDFSIISCSAFLFVPDAGYLSDTIDNFRENVMTHFPLGYLSDFMTILEDTPESSLTVIDATIPNGIVGSGSNISLSLNGVLDPILNATTSTYTNSSASSTETFYEITVGYWRIIVYILAFLYILRRILGSHVIPEHNHFGEHGALSDTNSNDDSYRLKEYLYNHQKK